ncbi:MAG: RNA polymerase sigma factor [Bacteroidota bacterium]
MEASYTEIHRDIIERCHRGERSAQNQLYKLYAKAMFNVSFRITNDLNDAEDILQDAFISAFKNLKSYRAEASFGAWLKRIVVNKSINHLKKKHLQLEQLSETEVDRGEDNPWEDQFEQVNLDVRRVKNAIRSLPDGYRLVFSLYLLEGYDHKEIASILDITESTSKSQYNRSKKKIKEILEKEEHYGR